MCPTWFGKGLDSYCLLGTQAHHHFIFDNHLVITLPETRDPSGQVSGEESWRILYELLSALASKWYISFLPEPLV
jgi:hypothetical protein